MVLQHPSGSSLVRGDLAELFDTASSSGAEVASARLSAASRADGLSLLRSVAQPRTALREIRVSVLGNGPWSIALSAQLGERLRQRVSHVLVATERAAPRWRLPRREVMQVRVDTATRSVFDDNDVVICALENVPLSSFMTLNRLALAGRAAVLFPFFDREVVRIGPVLYDGAPPCFFCERIRGLGLDPSDHILAETLDALVVDAPQASSPYLEEAIRLAVVDEILRLVADGVPHAPGTALVIGHGAPGERSPVPSLSGCPGCAELRVRSVRAEPEPEAAAPLAVPPFERTQRELERRGASAMGHARTSFLEHLSGTARILASWGEPESTCLAGLCHSVYGSDTFEKALFSRDRRHELRALIGDEAEALVHLFGTADRRRLWTDAALSETFFAFRTGDALVTSAALRKRIGVIDLANTAEQVAADDRSPGLWLARAVLRAQSLGWEAIPPPFEGVTMGFDEEREARMLYREAYAEIANTPALAFAKLLTVRSLNPVVGEPLVLAGELATRAGCFEYAATLAREGAARIRLLGTSWDKRFTSDDWIGRAMRVARSTAASCTSEASS